MWRLRQRDNNKRLESLWVKYVIETLGPWLWVICWLILIPESYTIHEYIQACVAYSTHTHAHVYTHVRYHLPFPHSLDVSIFSLSKCWCVTKVLTCFIWIQFHWTFDIFIVVFCFLYSYFQLNSIFHTWGRKWDFSLQGQVYARDRVKGVSWSMIQIPLLFGGMNDSINMKKNLYLKT